MTGQFARSVGIAVLGLAIAATAFGRSLQRAVRIDPVGMDAGSPPAVQATAVPVVGERVSEDALRLAVENNPFREARAPSSARYRLPGDVVERAAFARERPEVPAPSFQVRGLLSLGESGYAVVETEEGARSVIAIGESMEGYRLTRIDGKTATVSLSGQDFALMVPDGDPHPAPPSRGRNGRNNNNNNNNGRGNRGRGANNADAAAAEFEAALRDQLLQQLGRAGRAGRGGRGRGGGGGV